MQNINTEIHQAFEIIQNGGIILYPTDTVWGIGCDATNPAAVSKIYQLKLRAETHSMICLISVKLTIDLHNKFRYYTL